MKIKPMLVGAILVALFGFSPIHYTYAQSTDAAADSSNKAPANWFNLDPSENHVPGVSTEKAYQLLKNKTSKPIVVGVIDSGVDITHEDLKDNLWINEDEIAGNGIDDDKNGYIDDVHGWNFIGGKDGKNVNEDSYEVTREYARMKTKFEGVKKVKKKDKKEYETYTKVKAEYENKLKELQQQETGFKSVYESYKKANQVIKEHTGKDNLTAEELKAITTTDEKVTQAKMMLLYMDENHYDKAAFEGFQKYLDNSLKYGYNLTFNPRSIVGDREDDVKEQFYGNNDVAGPDPDHGTHVAGIIAANRTNNLGITGIADNVKIMVVRAVPNGDERDKDIANAIRYAVDNGAKVINMSFGKAYSPHKEAVDKAVSYAASKGVLLVHAAGNSSFNVDTTTSFPTVKNGKVGKATQTWLEVGASSWEGNEDLPGSFSNYGKNSVDVFAPGVDVYSTVPNQGYKANSGTSMAAPVTSGVAALLMSYYPTLSAEQVKEIIMKSTVKYTDKKVALPGSKAEEPTLVPFSELSKTGGVVNAYEAVKMAESLSKQP